MIVGEMKWAATLLCMSFWVNLGSAAELTRARTVYLMPMSRGLDQFIANRLTRMHVLQVVTDPAKADAVITDQVGIPLEDRLKELYPPPPDPQAIEAAKAKAAAREAAAKEKAQLAGVAPVQVRPSILDDTVNKADKQGGMGVSGRGRGTVFLVDVKSREVLWSAFDRPKNSTPHELDHTAERVVKQLKQDLSPKTK